jgi:signal transduction histidine kinase/CheY-like chemotaxis protein
LAFDVIEPQSNQCYHVSNAPIFHNDGTISNLAVLRDTTELRNLEGQLIQAQKMESIGTLAGGIAHDFNNILSAIIGNAEIALLDIPSDSALSENINNVIQAGQRARDLVKQILTFSRKNEEDKKPVQVHLIVNEVLKFLRSSLPSTIQILQNIEIGNDTVLADSTQIHQILMNLCANASHAMMEKGGVLQVNLKNMALGTDVNAHYPGIEPGSYLYLTVSDTGHGISPDVLSRIFEPYFTTKEKGSGTGLGLAVVHGIVKSHGGIIKADSEIGKGSTFHIYLPLIDEQEKSEIEAAESLPTGNERILFIDDEETLVDLGKQLLEKLGYEVVARTNSLEAFELFRKKPDQFDLVITDMTMPRMTGDGLAKKLIGIRPDVPIILCTGYSSKVSKNKVKRMGVKAFIMKPLLIRDLSVVVRKVLDEK